MGDIIVAAITVHLATKYANLISKSFRVSSKGPRTTYLGFDIDMNQPAHQCISCFMEKAFDRFKMVPKRPVKTPFPENFQAVFDGVDEEGDEQLATDLQYRETIDYFLYNMICMRPDTAYVVGLLARYTNNWPVPTLLSLELGQCSSGILRSLAQRPYSLQLTRRPSRSCACVGY